MKITKTETYVRDMRYSDHPITKKTTVWEYEGFDIKEKVSVEPKIKTEEGKDNEASYDGYTLKHWDKEGGK